MATKRRYEDIEDPYHRERVNPHPYYYRDQGYDSSRVNHRNYNRSNYRRSNRRSNNYRRSNRRSENYRRSYRRRSFRNDPVFNADDCRNRYDDLSRYCSNRTFLDESYYHPKRPGNELADSQMRHSDTAHEVDSYYAAYHDHEGHFKYVLGEAIGELLSSSKEPQRRRYKLLEKVGQGTFGRVFKCWDRVKQMIVAVKVVRAVKKYTDSAHVEIDILSKIQNHSRDDPTATQYCIKLLSWFSFKGHMCLVFPYCGLSLYDFLKKNDFRPFEMHVIRDIAYDLFLSLHFMHGRMNLIHTDLKPENVLFKYSEVVYKDNPDYLVGDARMSEVSPETSSRSRSRSSSTSRLHSDDRSTTTFRAPVSSKIRVIDLGSAIFDDEHHSSVISTRHYRAPEVILRLGWRYPADIWSIGCILLELYTGDTTFQTHHNTEHLAMMETILGPFPKNMLFYQDDDSNTLESKNSTVEKYFRQNDQQFCVDYPQKSTSSRSKRRVSELQKLEELIDIENHPDFYDLIKKTLLYEPEKRITAREALEHSFFTSYQTPCTTTNSS